MKMDGSSEAVTRNPNPDPESSPVVQVSSSRSLVYHQIVHEQRRRCRELFTRTISTFWIE